MKPPALQITLTLVNPGEGWHYFAVRRGLPIADSDGETFPNAGPALKACFEEMAAQMRAISATHEGEGADHE